MFYFIGYSFYRTTLNWLTLACIFRLSIHVVKHVEKKKVCQFSLLKIYRLVFVDKSLMLVLGSCCYSSSSKINMSQFVFNFHTFMILFPHSSKFGGLTCVTRCIWKLTNIEMMIRNLTLNNRTFYFVKLVRIVLTNTMIHIVLMKP